MIQGPHFKHLTNSYVDALGLESFPVDRGTFSVVWVSEDAPKPVTMRGFDIAVVYNHGLYVREHDGLAWTRSE